MPQYGPVYPRAATQLPYSGAYGAPHAQNWSNPAAARVQDGSWSEVWTRGSDGQSHWLTLYDFDWTGLPDAVRVRGLKMEVLARCRRDTYPYSQIRYLRLRVTENASTGWEATQRQGPWLRDAWGFTWFEVGGDGDTWGVTLERWHFNRDFGVMISAFTSGWQTFFTPIGSTADVEAVRLTVYYDEIDPREHQTYSDPAGVMDSLQIEDLASPTLGRVECGFEHWINGVPVCHLRYSGDMAYWVPWRIPEIQVAEPVITVLDTVSETGGTLSTGDQDPEVDRGQRTVPGTGDRPGGRYWQKEDADTTWQKA